LQRKPLGFGTSTVSPIGIGKFKAKAAVGRSEFGKQMLLRVIKKSPEADAKKSAGHTIECA